jgi:hypothetical protein
MNATLRAVCMFFSVLLPSLRCVLCLGQLEWFVSAYAGVTATRIA